ncbi:acyl-CoA dehydratase activase-related protein [Caloramator sp. Dgby_cultured_2]|nr:acyl-CoA dehydratase activase-related protein [Caloramator sp. Dgby_cultured_2]WDU83407.1 acyl-CoA dehydratase activase-related protein [Caloramator sp. Dgby_cultured_2]
MAYFFTALGFEVVLSDKTTKKLYEDGMETIPSDTICYPAKVVHGHIMNLVKRELTLYFIHLLFMRKRI